MTVTVFHFRKSRLIFSNYRRPVDRGNKALAVVEDANTGFIILIVMAEVTALEFCSQFYDRVVSIFGPPAIFVHGS